MKKTYLFFCALLMCSFTFAQAPQGGKNYKVKNVETDLYLTIVSNNWNVTRIAEETGDEDQIFTLLEVADAPGVFNISFEGKVLTKNASNGWDCILGEDPATDAAKFVLTTEGENTTIKLLANKEADIYFAPQGGGAGSTCYLNSNPGFEQWKFEEVIETGELEVKTLNPLADAVDVSSTTAISVLFTKAIEAGDLTGVTIKDAAGTAVDGVTASAFGSRLTITYGALAFGTVYTITIPVGAIVGYTEPISWSFTTATPVLPMEPRSYNIINASTGFYLTAPVTPPAADSRLNTTTKIEGEGEDTQVFRFTNPDPSKPEVFNISIGGQYIAKLPNSAWTVLLTDDPTAPEAQFITVVDGVGIKIKALTATGDVYLAPNNANDKTACYLDKTALAVWRLEQVAEPVALYKTTPVDDANAIALNAEIKATFNQTVTAVDLTGITIKDAEGVAVADVAATVKDYIVEITHAEFAYATEYTVTIPAGAVDGLTESVSWSFTTRNAPSVDSTTPTADGKNVAVDVKINVFYTENVIAAGTLEGIVIKNAAGEAVEEVSATLVDNMLVIAHAMFDYETEYTVTVPGGTIKGINTPYSWSFTTTTAPKLKSTTPADGATDVALSTIIRLTFDKKIIALDTNGVIAKDPAGNQVSDVVSPSNSNLNIAHTTLSEGTLYTVIVPANSIKGVTEEIKFSFTTLGIVSGINDVNAEGVSVYPAVSKGQITVITPAGATINVVDIAGRNQATYESNGEVVINMDYPNGIYIIQVNTNGNISSHKVILQK